MALIESLRISTHRVVQMSRVAACFSLRKCLIYLLCHCNVSMKCAWTAVIPDWLGKTLHRRYPVGPLQSKVSRGVALTALYCLQSFLKPSLTHLLHGLSVFSAWGFHLCTLHFARMGCAVKCPPLEMFSFPALIISPVSPFSLQ